MHWFRDYLSNRQQITSISNHNSKRATVSTGVPQGSVLGPILFLIFINDLPTISDSLFFSLFADDSCLSLTDKDLFELITSANIEIDKFYEWCIANRLSINTIKTYYLLFTSKSTANLPPLVIRNHSTYDIIKRVSHTKFLGVIYDEKLNFSHHITMLCNRLSRSSSLIYQLRDVLPIYVLKKLYYAHVYPHIHYCNCIWANTYQRHLTPLVLIHKRIIRNIAKAEFLAHTEPLYKNLRILNIDNIRKMNLALMMFKQINTNEFDLTLATPDHQYLTRNRDLLIVPQHRTTLQANSFSIQGIRTWNDIPNGIKESRTLNSFKIKIKKFLIS